MNAPIDISGFLIRSAAQCFEIEDGSILSSRRRSRKVAEARMGAMAVISEVFPTLPFWLIGKWFGRDRVTVYHARSRTRDLREIDPDFRSKCDELKLKIQPDLIMNSEIEKYRHMVDKYCQGNGIDIGSGGTPICPRAIQIEMSLKQSMHYRSGVGYASPIQWHDDNAAIDLPFKDRTLDYVASSHLLEDFLDWWPVLREWVRVLKPGGHLIIGVPDKARWAKAVANGQIPNFAHRHESFPGELSTYAPRLGLVVIEDRLTENPPGDYNILFVGRKK